MPSNCSRRAALGAAGSGLLAALAGCRSGLGRTVTLEPSDRQTRRDGPGTGETVFYRHEDEEVARVRLAQVRAQERPTSEFPIEVAVEHGRETTIDSLRFDLRAPVDEGDAPAGVYLLARRPRITVETIGDGWVRVDVTEIEAVGRGDVTFPARVSPIDPVTTLETRGEVTVSTTDSSPDRTYRLEPRMELSLVTR